jgi:general stress protein 26
MDTSLYGKINDLMSGHNFLIHTLTEYDPSERSVLYMYGIFHEGHLIGVINLKTKDAVAICTDIRYNSRLEILFQDILEVLGVNNYTFSAPDYQ